MIDCTCDFDYRYSSGGCFCHDLQIESCKDRDEEAAIVEVKSRYRGTGYSPHPFIMILRIFLVGGYAI